jgi:hypothetical protein
MAYFKEGTEEDDKTKESVGEGGKSTSMAEERLLAQDEEEEEEKNSPGDTTSGSEKDLELFADPTAACQSRQTKKRKLVTTEARKPEPSKEAMPKKKKPASSSAGKSTAVKKTTSHSAGKTVPKTSFDALKKKLAQEKKRIAEIKTNVTKQLRKK